MEYAHAGKPVGYATWQSIYPLYINSKRSVKCGRRLSRESAVENPTIDEILQALTQIGFKNEENMLKEDKVLIFRLFLVFFDYFGLFFDYFWSFFLLFFDYFWPFLTIFGHS